MILDMNIKLEGIDKDFLEELDELIEDTRVEYFILNPKDSNDLARAQELSKENERFKYTIPIKDIKSKDENCIAIRIYKEEDLEKVEKLPLVIESENLNEAFIYSLNNTKRKGVVLNAKQCDSSLENFAFSLSQKSLDFWEQKYIMNFDYNKLALQSDYPNQSYDDFLDVMLKKISDMTFRAEQTIAAGGTRTILKTFGML